MSKKNKRRERRDEEPEEGYIEDHPEGEDFDVDVEVDVDCNMRRDADGFFGKDGPFGPNGPFGPRGPFGPGGPFGPAGLFGPQGIFGKGGSGRGHRGSGQQRGQRRRGRMFRPGELRLVLLSLINEEPRHGYDCIKALEEATGGAYAPSPGVVYPTLQMLLDEGLIAERASDDSRKVYEATPAGLEELEANTDEIEELLERLGRRAKRASAAQSSDMVRALGNLASVLANRGARGELQGETRDKAVDLIDELARRIERL
ncbi:PadR family transcriptional regulator [Aurantiacibacter poecillastricola]|uniref:PadR family transcriptional regulator n=1 Tax=Aurantiacibacter poecillastricola TaxID=3064385 RepID=UPI00273FCB51|nr:PadR family transcriptional regulator [Aurantiacibacter sp. 219JJ12-13]MDP5262939.1 PadR family transcriptional regulator [Aurantiacibacter sp. 219JJ12-13]